MSIKISCSKSSNTLVGIPIKSINQSYSISSLITALAQHSVEQYISTPDTITIIWIQMSNIVGIAFRYNHS
jgi:hypothetical protein